MPQYEGQCHCGAVTYSAEISDEAHILCHCSACKIIGGGEYTLNQIIPKDKLKITKGKLNKYTYKGDSGNSTDCFFCGDCTAHPYHQQHVLGDDKIVIRTGLLKGAEMWGKPVAEIYGKDKLSWQPRVAGVIFDLTPPS